MCRKRGSEKSASSSWMPAYGIRMHPSAIKRRQTRAGRSRVIAFFRSGDEKSSLEAGMRVFTGSGNSIR
jgi:hypothetical protein